MRLFNVVLKYYDGNELLDFSHTEFYSFAMDAIEEAAKLFRNSCDYPFAFYSVTDVGSFGDNRSNQDAE